MASNTDAGFSSAGVLTHGALPEPMYHGHGDLMGTEEFEKFVASQQVTEVDTETRDEWLKDLDSLYRKIDGFLEKYIKGGSISRDFAEIELTEPGIGAYLARRMHIKIGRQHVTLLPVGTLLIGCKGRVDAEGSGGRAQILLVDEQARSAADLAGVSVSVGKVLPPRSARKPTSWAWKILTNSAQRRFVDLDKKTFFDLLTEIASA
jgi:hypothetical protein